MELIDQVTDSIWYARGNENPYDYYEEVNEDVLNEEIYDENTQVENSFPDATLDPNEKNYNELRDSVQLVLQREQLDKILIQLLVQNDNLIRLDPRFEEQLTHPVEGIFTWIMRVISISQVAYGIFKLFFQACTKIFRNCMLEILFLEIYFSKINQ